MHVCMFGVCMYVNICVWLHVQNPEVDVGTHLSISIRKCLLESNALSLCEAIGRVS